MQPAVSEDAPDRPDRWQARPVLARVVRTVLLAVPLVLSTLSAYAAGRLLTRDAPLTWWRLLLVLAVAVLVAAALERAVRRLLPLAVLLRLAMVFPDRAPSRLALARAAAVRTPRSELVWSGSTVRPVSTAELVLDLLTALGTHDRRTRGHSERVRVLCDMLAVELGLDQGARDRLHWAALLHDVGKMSVPTRILNKPSALDAREFADVKQHPVSGARLAAPLLPWLGEWGEGIVDHHERYDGSGYPAGKAGDEISAAGRLIAVVDAFETMTAARPYKRAVATRTAREELARCAGTHFDPVYVRAFLSVSLPRVLWTMGPLSFLLQLPFLRPIAQAGTRTGEISGTAAALTVGAAGAAVLATGGAVVVADDLRPRDPVEQAREDAGRDRSEASTLRTPVLDELSPQRPRRTAPRGGIAPPTAVAPAPVAPPPAAAPAPAAPAPAPAPPAAPAPRAGRPAPAPAPAQQDPSPILDGPPATTTSNTATFVLRRVAGVQWECQLLGNAGGGGSAWQPCSGTWTVTVKDGTHTFRVRDAATPTAVSEREWTVVPE